MQLAYPCCTVATLLPSLAEPTVCTRLCLRNCFLAPWNPCEASQRLQHFSDPSALPLAAPPAMPQEPPWALASLCFYAPPKRCWLDFATPPASMLAVSVATTLLASCAVHMATLRLFCAWLGSALRFARTTRSCGIAGICVGIAGCRHGQGHPSRGIACRTPHHDLLAHSSLCWPRARYRKDTCTRTPSTRRCWPCHPWP